MSHIRQGEIIGMSTISTFDIFKIGIGPSSSHTMGPWRAALDFLTRIGPLEAITRVRIDLYGSLAKTGKGHGTDYGTVMGLAGYEPSTCAAEELPIVTNLAWKKHQLHLGGQHSIEFVPERDVVFHFDRFLPHHPNGMTLTAFQGDGTLHAETYYSIGGGFIEREGDSPHSDSEQNIPHPFATAAELLQHCRTHGTNIAEVVLRNEHALRQPGEVQQQLTRLQEAMRACIYRGCHQEGVLPGNLGVVRRAAAIARTLLPNSAKLTIQEWWAAIGASGQQFSKVSLWISCFALAVNEENAAFGRVVTAPTNGAAGVVPAVFIYQQLFYPADEESAATFLLTAGAVGSLFKTGATISAAMGGCQAEIGVSSAMAAAGLTATCGGTPEQVLMAAEIAMEHHLGLTCDPVGGLVQIPCIERNTMGAIKAISASQLAMNSDPSKALVSLDAVIRTMWETARDMGTKYKETAEGGLALQIAVNVSEC
ncbi:MAG: L-serine ammonia-lyase [Zavarzinella sp.]